MTSWVKTLPWRRNWWSAWRALSTSSRLPGVFLISCFSSGSGRTVRYGSWNATRRRQLGSERSTQANSESSGLPPAMQVQTRSEAAVDTLLANAVTTTSSCTVLTPYSGNGIIWTKHASIRRSPPNSRIQSSSPATTHH